MLKGRQYRAFAVALACTYGAMFAVIAGSSAVFINLLGLSSLEYGINFGLIVSMLIVGTTTATCCNLATACIRSAVIPREPVDPALREKLKGWYEERVKPAIRGKI